MTFESIVRMWCKRYKLMRDSPQNRRFYFTDSTAGVVELVKNINHKFSPCVVMESDVEGGGPIERPSMTYPIYFFVRAEEMSDGDAAVVAKNAAKMHAMRFLSWLKKKHDQELAEKPDGDFARIDLSGYINFSTVGPLQDGWYAVLVQLEREEPLNLCVDEDLYDENCECEEE